VTRGGRYDGDARWSVEDGAIVGRTNEQGEGGLLYTARDYTSFDLEFETRLDYPFDSGVFVRMRPAPFGKGAQITLDYRETGEVGAVYADGFLAHNTEGKALLRRDAWNHVRVRCTGFDMRLECWLNGTKITDYQMPPDEPGYAPSGLIGLQVHGGGSEGPACAARFRNLRLRELPIFEEELFRPASAHHPELLRLSPRAREEGWAALFDGSDVDAWASSSSADMARIVDGVLRISADSAGHLATREDFGDFALRLDFRVPRMGNSGVFLRAARDGSNPAFSGCEIQVLDDFNWERETGDTLRNWQFTGSLYGSVAAPKDKLYRALGEWNTYEILYRGRRLAVALNGRTLYDVDVDHVPLNDHPPFARRATQGFLGLQAHSAASASPDEGVEYRNIFVRRL
jgi:hypothetical protein